EGPNIVHSSTNGTVTASYSTDGGVTFNACVVSAGFILIGYDGTTWAAIARGASDSYTSADGINFTSGPALPTTTAESYNKSISTGASSLASTSMPRTES